MKDSMILKPISRINGTVDLPGSKSISNRALLLAAMSEGTTKLKNLLNSDDVKYMLYALHKLGISYKLYNNNTTCEIIGNAGPLKSLNTLKLFLGNAGTVMRPLTAALCLGSQDIILTGEQRMKERPIGHLVDVLRKGGAKINYLEKINYPPIRIYGGFLGGKLIIDSSISSQFLTSLLMVSPLAAQDTKISVKSNLVSKPYIDITLKMMNDFGIKIENQDYNNFYIQGKQKYRSPKEYLIEGDASSASYFLAAGAIKGGTVCVKGIGYNSIQGDIRFIDILEDMGADVHRNKNYISCSVAKLNKLHAVNMDMNDIPDVAMTVAVMSLFSKGITKIRNIYNWRLKETDRIVAMATELRKLGAKVKEGYDYIFIKPSRNITHANINTYNDHRMAMCFSLVALSDTPVTINNPNCTSKTFPEYFREFDKISQY
ncbi:3-phosphoshikimate 1-carboxyvinyltransferase [Candidatus Pantoea edessiphila]|uniref:3-phosphoshikimate 1-carboxyvinyltransferase n=1 Tax=Candidatus Pantoea edessiphila TaxID=2044610 RepID=A0A2P5T2H2_9GAMM|nr:3-phosphoshikimate 1-carboxyvinyltransferase [Candidatus Pantoea edessiphila]PPI88750.1 3-phosphoshikimate 1-carboxyvinyltransferase [Candidatus Pantoea edessiphila]